MRKGDKSAVADLSKSFLLKAGASRCCSKNLYGFVCAIAVQLRQIELSTADALSYDLYRTQNFIKQKRNRFCYALRRHRSAFPVSHGRYSNAKEIDLSAVPRIACKTKRRRQNKTTALYYQRSRRAIQNGIYTKIKREKARNP